MQKGALKHKILLYGANGYTGELILIELLKESELKVIIAGRNSQKIAALAKNYNLESDVFDVAGAEFALQKHIGCILVINAAGPFTKTATLLANACIKNHMHYVDITGEIAVFQELQKLNQLAVNAGTMLLPGAGFDVVPTDCLANKLKSELPNATHLEMAFASKGGGLSRGTAKTSVAGMGHGTVKRIASRLVSVPWKRQEKLIDFGTFTAACLPIPWGDLETAWVSTKIPNIAVYTPFGKKTRKHLGKISKIMRLGFVRRMALFAIEKRMYGPTESEREQSPTYIVGKAWNEKGEQKSLRLKTPNGYTFTALCVANFAARIAKGEFRSGFRTPATAFGFDCVEKIEGVEYMEVDKN